MLFILIFVSQLSFSTIDAREGVNYHSSLSLQFTKIKDELKEIWLSADGSWYREVAEEGYAKKPCSKTTPYNWPFFPLFPLAARAVMAVLGTFLRSALLLSNLCFFFSLLLLQRYCLEEGLNDEETKSALWFLAFYPVGYFLSSPHTESLFLLLLLSTFLLIKKDKFFFAAITMMLLTATRVTGIVLYPAFAAALHEKKVLFTPRGLVCLAAAPLGCLAFSLYLGLQTGHPLAWMLNQQAWGREVIQFQNSFYPLASSLTAIIAPWNFTALNASLALLALGGAAYFARLRTPSYALILALPVLVPLSTGTFMSVGRFTMVSFPLYFMLGRFAAKHKLEPALLAVSVVLFTIMTAFYALHVTAGMT